MTDLCGTFGSMVFNDTAMRAYLPEETYIKLKKTIDDGEPLDTALADDVAEGMKKWAVERGATHYTHWFQPQTGITAEKHESFLDPAPGGAAILSFSGRALIKGESDASSFPSGGLRATFEARGYTAWDPTSYAFLKDDILCIPTAFCSYSGEALDKKTPLLRSMRALEKQSLRVLRLFGTDAGRVYATAGAEQEYFLVARSVYSARRDLLYTGRTLFGVMPPKGQELDDFYYGALETRVSDYMKDLNNELWKLGILAKTEHNEAAPGQHELAPMFSTASIACDQNQLMMEMMTKVAQRHGLACLLHEKPFRGINGSGKHVNWSIATDTGINLLNPGDTPSGNARFLTFFCAVLAAVDEYQELLRLSTADCGNDLRLGANEAPPAIISVFVGDEMEAILESIKTGRRYSGPENDVLRIGVDTLPPIPKDSTDRNRTATIAFTGNRFEFRMPGSSASISDACTALNTIVADKLMDFADTLESAGDFNSALNALLRETVKQHSRIIFNGNGYAPQWVDEAERRTLANLATTADAVPHLLDDKIVDVMGRHGIYTKAELSANCSIKLDAYCKKLRIEALTMSDMARRQVIPAAVSCMKVLSDEINAKLAACPGINVSNEREWLKNVSALTDDISAAIGALRSAVDCAHSAVEFRDNVIPAMAALREPVDTLETMLSAGDWPYPTYGDLLFRY